MIVLKERIVIKLKVENVLRLSNSLFMLKRGFVVFY